MAWKPYNDRRGPICQVRAVSTVALAGGPETVDGVSIVAKDIVLQAVPGATVGNGIWEIGPTVNRRPRWADKATHYRLGKLASPSEGTAHGGSVWRLKTASVTPGTTAHEWELTPMRAADLVAAATISGISYIGTRTIAQVNALSPSAGDLVVAGDGGTPTAGTSDALVEGDGAEYDGTQWQKIWAADADDAPPQGTRVLVAATGTTLYAPLTDVTDNTKMAYFGGASKTPQLTTPTTGQEVRCIDTDSLFVGYSVYYTGSAWANHLIEEQLRDAASGLSAALDVNSQKITSLAACTAGTDAANKTYVDTAVAAAEAGLLDYQGAYNAATNTPDLDTSPSGVATGDTYTVTAAGTFFTAAVEIGDMLIAEADNATTEAEWTIVEHNIVGADVALNTTHRSSDGTDHANVVLNDTHRASSGTDHANVVLNDTHRASDGTDHANVVLNDTHRASDGTDHANVVLNDTHRASDGTDHANVVLNDTHRASDGTDHANVVLNDTHRASDGTDHANVVLNDTHRASDGSDHADVVTNSAKLTCDETNVLAALATGATAKDMGGGAITNVGNVDGIDVGTDVAANTAKVSCTAANVVTALASAASALDVNAQNITNVGTVDGIDVGTDVAANTAKVSCTAANVVTALASAASALDVNAQNITNVGTVDGIDIATDVAANTAKVTCTEPNVRTALASAAGDVAVNSQKITGVGTPAAATDAATKGYVDADVLKPVAGTVGAAHTDTVAAPFKVVNGAGTDVAAVTPIEWWLSDSAATGAISGTTPDGGISFTTGSGLSEYTADLHGTCVTDSSGDATISVNHTGGAHDWYLWIAIGGHVDTSTKIEITA